MPKLNIKINFEKEHWFIREKYPATQKVIGSRDFARIINFNVPEARSLRRNLLIKALSRHLQNNRAKITSNLLAEKNIYQKKWQKFERGFFGRAR